MEPTGVRPNFVREPAASRWQVLLFGIRGHPRVLFSGVLIPTAEKMGGSRCYSGGSYKTTCTRIRAYNNLR